MSPAETPRVRPLAAAVVVLALYVVTFGALGDVFQAGVWQAWAAGVVAAIVVLPAALRAAQPTARLSASTVGVLAGLGVVLAEAAWAGRLGVWIDEPGASVDAVRLTLYTSTAPVEVAGPLTEMLLLACLALAWVSSLLAVAMDAVLLAGVVPALVLLVVPAVTSHRVGTPALLATAALLGVLLWIGAWQSGRAALRGVWWQGAVSVVVTAAVAAAGAAALPATPDTVWNTRAVSRSPMASGTPDVTIALGEDLRARSATPAFIYSGFEMGASVRFPLAVLTVFEGGTWHPEEEIDETAESVMVERSPLAQADPAPWTGGEDPGVRVTVEVESLLSTWLPLPQGTVQVSEGAAGSWRPSRWVWVRDTQTARSETSFTERGDTYHALACPLIGALAAEECASPSGDQTWPVDQADGEVDLSAFTDLPDDIQPGIAEAAQAVTSGATTRLQAAQELEAWFRGGDFTYDEQAPYAPGADPEDPYQTITAFLDQRQGYCVHFATAYAAMARTLGMPARVAVGYASQSRGSAGTVVTARDLHAWPEIYFEGVGWVAFEPTPGGAGVRADSGDDEDPMSGEAGAAEPTSSSADQQSGRDPGDLGSLGVSSATPSPGAAGGRGDAVWGVVGLVALGLLGVALVAGTAPAVIRWVRRRRRTAAIRGGRSPARAAWEEVVDTAVDLRVLERPGPDDAASRADRPGSPSSARPNSPPAPRARTPEAVAEHLATTGAMDSAAEEPVRALAALVVAEQFGGRDAPADRVRVALRAVLAGMRRHADARTRVHAALWPRSVVGWGPAVGPRPLRRRRRQP